MNTQYQVYMSRIVVYIYTGIPCPWYIHTVEYNTLNSTRLLERLRQLSLPVGRYRPPYVKF